MKMDQRYLDMLRDEVYPAKRPTIWANKMEGGMLGGFKAFFNWFKGIMPSVFVLIVFIGGWEVIIRLLDIKAYLLPKPSDIVGVMNDRWSNLLTSISTTILESILGFGISVILGVGAAIVLALSKTVEKSIYPYAIILQTIPIVAVAPIIVIWFGAGLQAVVIIVFLISFFPILSNTVIGLNSTDQNMKNLFYLYNASRMQTMWRLRVPAAMPFILAGLKISCSLSVIGAIVGEYIAGVGGGKGGLGYAITVAAARLDTPYLFASGLSASVLGILFFLMINALSKKLLSSWHESEMR
jgi:NitT/TauT family transport system permease protein